jgi:hypothetical protein
VTVFYWKKIGLEISTTGETTTTKIDEAIAGPKTTITTVSITFITWKLQKLQLQPSY